MKTETYVLTTTIGTFKLKEPLKSFEKEMKKDKGLLTCDNITEGGDDAVLNLNLEKVDLLGYYIISSEENND